MKAEFLGNCNRSIPNTVVFCEAEGKWAIILGGLLKVDRYNLMQDAVDAVDAVTSTSRSNLIMMNFERPSIEDLLES